MSVDRSYSSYEVIRAYQDRGMMKWGSFATGELTEAQNAFVKEQNSDKILQPLSHHIILHLLNQSFTNQVQVKIKYQLRTSDKLKNIGMPKTKIQLMAGNSIVVPKLEAIFTSILKRIVEKSYQNKKRLKK